MQISKKKKKLFFDIKIDNIRLHQKMISIRKH